MKGEISGRAKSFDRPFRHGKLDAVAYARTMNAAARKNSPPTIAGLPFDAVMHRARKLVPGKAKKK
jgi:hypothetical protein